MNTRTLFFLLLLSSFALWTSVSSALMCVDLFDSRPSRLNLPFESSLQIKTNPSPENGATAFHRIYNESGFASLKLVWPQGHESGPLKILNRFSLLRPDPQIIGPYDLQRIGPYVGPRLFISSSRIQTKFSIEILSNGEPFRATFVVRRSPTFVGLRALDFVSLKTGQKLQSWPENMSEISFKTDENTSIELNLHGAIDITFNPRPSDLFQSMKNESMILAEYLLSAAKVNQNEKLTGEEIRGFLKIYKDFFNDEKLEFAQRLSKMGPIEMRKYLRQNGFDSQHLKKGGQLTMRDYLLNFRNTESANLINIPSEPGYFGQAHGTYSHALQMAALTKDLTPDQLLLAQKVMKALTNADHPESWLAWAGLFNGFSGDGPHTTPWWPE